MVFPPMAMWNCLIRGFGMRSDTGINAGAIGAVDEEPFIAWTHHPLALRKARKNSSAAELGRRWRSSLDVI
jgi:hypothetical protein